MNNDSDAYIREQLALVRAQGRFSTAFVRQLGFLYENRIFNVHRIFDEIAYLEAPTAARPTTTKVAAKFRRPPLLGLWHKHFSDAAFIGRNILNHWTDEKMTALFHSINQDQSIPDARKLDVLSHKLILKGYEERSQDSKLTGEWIVYVRESGRNSYLTLGAHGHDNDVLLLVRACAAEFPDLRLP